MNLHAAVDGWGRPTRALETVIDLDPDVAVCPETWRGDDGDDHVARLAAALGARVEFAPLARAERVTSGAGPGTWQPRLAHLTGERGLFFHEHRDLTRAQHESRRATTREHGTWGLSLTTRLVVEDVREVSMGRLAREKVNRSVIVARLVEAGRPFHLVALHGAHLSHGSYRQYRRVRALVATLDPDTPLLLVGDFNSWRPLLRLFLPGYRTLVRARTWPARHPHSQIDHVLGRGPWRVSGAGARDGGSDHRALFVDLELA